MLVNIKRTTKNILLHILCVPLAGLLVFSGLQAAGWSKSFSCPCGGTAEEAATRTSHTRQATDLRPLHQLPQVCTIPQSKAEYSKEWNEYTDDLGMLQRFRTKVAAKV